MAFSRFNSSGMWRRRTALGPSERAFSGVGWTSMKKPATPTAAAARAKGTLAAARVRTAKALESYREIAPMMAELREAGFTLQQIADRLNEEGIATRRGRAWSAMQVSRVLDRFDK